MKNIYNKRDFMVLIVCTIFLIFTIGSVGKRGREQARRMVCASNIKTQLSALMLFAEENEGGFPSTGGFWPWDFEYHRANQILRCMGVDVQKPSVEEDIPVQDVFYCPSNFPQIIARNIYWHFAVDSANERGYRLAGYVFMWPATWNSHGGAPILGSGNKRWVKTIYVDEPAETELVVDAIMSQNGNFGKITVGGMPVFGFFDSSSHLKTAREPAGGNIGFVDGHVQWRLFDEMEIRYQAGPYWWW